MNVQNPNWQDVADVDRWQDEWREAVKHRSLSFRGKVDPIEELRDRFAHGHFHGKDHIAVEGYLRTADQLAYRVSDQGKADREERMVVAAEQSARRSMLAIAVAVAALFVSAWPYIKEWLG